MTEIVEAKEFTPMREGPFRTHIQLPQTMPKSEINLPKLYEEVRIDLKEADLANRSQRITILKAGVIVGVLGIYLLLAALIFPSTRFFRRPDTVVWGSSATNMIDSRTMNQLPKEIREALEDGQFTHARQVLESTFFDKEILPGPDHFSWPAYLLTLNQTNDPKSSEVSRHLLGLNPEMMKALFYSALHSIQNAERSRLTPAWYDWKTQRYIEETNINLKTAISDLDRVIQRLVPLRNRWTRAQSEMLRQSYYYKADANYLLWLHDPARPKDVTKHLEDSFRYLKLASPERDSQPIEVVQLTIQIAETLDRLLYSGLWGERREHKLFGEDRNKDSLRNFIENIKKDLDQTRGLQ